MPYQGGTLFGSSNNNDANGLFSLNNSAAMGGNGAFPFGSGGNASAGNNSGNIRIPGTFWSWN